MAALICCGFIIHVMRLVHCTSCTRTQVHVYVMFSLYVMTLILCFQEPKLTRSRVRQAVASTVGEVNFSPNKQVQHLHVKMYSVLPRLNS